MNYAYLRFIPESFLYKISRGFIPSNAAYRFNICETSAFLTSTQKKSLLFLLFIIVSFGANAQLQPVFKFQQDDSLIKKNFYQKALPSCTKATIIFITDH